MCIQTFVHVLLEINYNVAAIKAIRLMVKVGCTSS